MISSRVVTNLCIIVGILSTSLLGAYKIQAEVNEITLYGETALLMDASSGQVLFEQGMNQTMYPASITKIVTAIVAIEEGELNELVTVSEHARNTIGTRVYLLENEQVSLKTLVQGLLINSGNDAGTAIAEHLSGSEKQFAKRMNEFVHQKIGVENTNFTNPHGLFDEEHVTTAYDMAKITQYAMQNELFREIVGTKELEWEGEGWETTLYNHNRLLWRYEGATGVKNGYVRQSGFTLVSTALREETELIAVTLNAASSEQAYRDMETMFNYGFDHYKNNKIARGQLFYTESGRLFQLLDDVHIVTKEDEEISVEVNGSGVLTVKKKDNESVITSTTLSPVAITQAKKERHERANQDFMEKQEKPSLLESWMTHLLSILKIK